MLRGLRIIGIVIFAILIGFSAHRLFELYRSGVLFEPYNSARRAGITLLLFSICGMGVLGFIDIHFQKNRNNRRGFNSRDTENDGPEVDGLDTANIYSAPKTVDNWHGMRTRTSNKRHAKPRDAALFCFGLLRIISFVTPMVYLSASIAWLAGWLPVGLSQPVWSVVFGSMLLLSLITAVGISLKKVWGSRFGYAIAIIHLLFFPFGTAAGLVLLLGLVGATPLFTLSPRESRQRERIRLEKKAAARMASPARS